MALVINDRVKETSTTSGTGNITLGGITAGQGNVTFNSGIGTGNTTYYCIFEQGSNLFEIGLGTLSGSTTLERTTVINNSSGSGKMFHVNNANSNWDLASCSYILNLNANDYVTMWSVSNTGWHGNNWGMFSGELLS